VRSWREGTEGFFEKHLPFYEVRDAMKTAQGCALCALEERGLRRYLEILLHERVHDGRIRDSLLRSRGYCSRHAHDLVRLPDHLGIAIIYRAQVSMFQEFLETPPHRGRYLRSWRKHEVCPACGYILQKRQRHAGVLAGWCEDGEMKYALEQAPPFCAEHTMAVLDRIEDAAAAAGFIGIQRRKLAALMGELDEFCAKQDIRRIGEPPGPERDSWERAVGVMASYRWP